MFPIVTFDFEVVEHPFGCCTATANAVVPELPVVKEMLLTFPPLVIVPFEIDQTYVAPDSNGTLAVAELAAQAVAGAEISGPASIGMSLTALLDPHLPLTVTLRRVVPESPGMKVTVVSDRVLPNVPFSTVHEEVPHMSSTPSRSTRYSLPLQTLEGALIEKSGGDLKIGKKSVKLRAPQISE